MILDDIKQLINQPEGRRIEFKIQFSENSDIAKTVVAFANDAGGDIFFGISDEPREIVGLDSDRLIKLEEQISNLIYDRCYPAILPEIKFISIDDKQLLQVRVFRGSTPPYYIKEQGKLNGTYIRIGSTNRKADIEIISELERKKRNISFDSEIFFDKTIKDLNINELKDVFKEKTGEVLDIHALRKQDLVREEQGVEYPTFALVLLSDDSLRNTLFHYAKVECARFKGTTSDVFIDRKSITSSIVLQAEEAYKFVLRNINEGATVEGVYTVGRWEYPIKAIREVIRNAVVHRDYSISGSDIKVAIYDDMIEITSPGLLYPSIDFDAMESRQSYARNKIIAPVFKRLGIIDQWGNGLKLIADELKEFPNIKLEWKEVGLLFQVQFIKTDYKDVGIIGGDVGINGGDVGIIGGDVGINGGDVGINEQLITLMKENSGISASELSKLLGVSTRHCERIISQLKDKGIIERYGSKKSGHWMVK